MPRKVGAGEAPQSKPMARRARRGRRLVIHLNSNLERGLQLVREQLAAQIPGVEVTDHQAAAHLLHQGLEHKGIDVLSPHPLETPEEVAHGDA